MNKSELSFDSISRVLEKKQLFKFTYASSILYNIRKMFHYSWKLLTWSKTVSVWNTVKKIRTKITHYQKKNCPSCVTIVCFLNYFPSNKILHNFETFMVKICSSDIVSDFSQSALLSCVAASLIGWKFSTPSNLCAPLRAGFKFPTNQ